MNETATYEAYFRQNETLISPFKGTSMMPLLKQGRDVFIVERKGTSRFQKGDVVLYRRAPDRYVLHRIIAVHQEDYTILGDNCAKTEHGITDRDILGVMVGYIRKGKEHRVSERPYRAYAAVWLHTRHLRIAFFRLRDLAARVYRKLFFKRT